MTTATTQKERIVTALRKTTKGLTVAELKSRLRVSNPRARVAELRADGVRIVSESYTKKNGAVAARYVLKATSRKAR